MPKKSITDNSQKKPWPANCPWPEPVEDGEGYFWEANDADCLPLDDTCEELLDIKEYMDELVQSGRLNEDYTLNQEYEDWEDGSDTEDSDFESSDEDDSDIEDEFVPDKGEEYWDEGFDIDSWDEDMVAQLNDLKLPLPSPVDAIQRIIGYEFINENLLRQAFTRRAFALEYGTGDSEVLELVGDSILNTVVTREISRHLTEVEMDSPAKPFTAPFDEGELSKIRAHYVCKEYLWERAAVLGLDQYILYGPGEEPTESSREDMMEALLGAVAADCDWDWHVLEGVVDQLLTIQLSEASSFLKPCYYDLFNSWHQKKFGRMPDYEVSKGMPVKNRPVDCQYYCTLRYFVPENDKGIWTSQRVDVQRETRSKARERAAEEAYSFVVNNGLWMNLSDAGIEPKLEDSINQLQELYQKKYVEKPEYSFEERKDLKDTWYCMCSCSGVEGWGAVPGKVKAKKKAAFMVLVRLFKSAGICRKEWEEDMWRTVV